MNWINLGNPRPHAQAKSYDFVSWGNGVIHYLEKPQRLPDVSFISVVASRRTHRQFGAVSFDELGKFFWLTVNLHCIENASLEIPLFHGAAPSAGAIHPIHIVVCDLQQQLYWRYVPVEHALMEIELSQLIAAGLTNDISQLIEVQEAKALLFVAEPGKTSAKYEDSCSLVWRDAGVLIGHMALVAEALNLAFCPLGITGEPWCSALNDEGKLVGVGMALLGSRAR